MMSSLNGNIIVLCCTSILCISLLLLRLKDVPMLYNPTQGLTSRYPGLHPLNERLVVPNITNHSSSQAEAMFYQFLQFDGFLCDEVERQGQIQDGGWDMCVVEPYRPKPGCIVYSFGISDDWSFDEALSQKYLCEVYSFDPSIGEDPDRNRSNTLVKFHPWGLAGKDYKTKKGWQMYTLASIMNRLGHEKRTLDYLKMDIEYYEWTSIGNILDGNLLRNIKQLGIEFHINKRHDNMEDYTRYIDILYGMEKVGFQRFSSHVNPTEFHDSHFRRIIVPCCWEFVYLNTNYLN